MIRLVLAAAAVAGLAACAKAPEPVANNAGNACLSPVLAWEADPVVRDVTLTRIGPNRVRAVMCVASARREGLQHARVDIRLTPRDGSQACIVNGQPAYCRVGGDLVQVAPTVTPMPLPARTVALISQEADLPADFGPFVQPHTAAEVTATVCPEPAGAACQTATTVQPIRATVVGNPAPR